MTRSYARLTDFISPITAQTINELQQALEDDDTRIAAKQDVSTLNIDVASTTVISRLTDRVFDARDYGFDIAAADNIDAINAAIADAAAAVTAGGGHARVVLGPSAKTAFVRPSKALGRKIIMQSGVTLDLSDITLKVADDADAYDDLITGTGTSKRLRITGGAIDTNADGHVAANIGIGANNKAYAIRFLTSLDGLIVDGVTFYCCGINTIVVNGADCHNIDIDGNTFVFQQGAAVTPNYDNSAVYLVADDIRVTNNDWSAAISQHARACCEIHGPNAAMTGNTSHGFETLANLVTPDFPYAGNRNNITVSGNSVVDGNGAITLWPVTGDVLRNVIITGNTIHLAQITHNQNGTWGINRSRATGITGDVEGYIVKGNVIAFQAGDTRTVDLNALALNTTSMVGIGLGGGGTTRHAHVEGNIILNAPQYGFRGGVAGSGALDDVWVVGNTIVDAGQNASLPARFAFYLGGTISNSEISENKVHDTGTPSNKGQYSYVVQVSGGGANVMTRNRVTTVSGAALSTSITNSDTYVSFLTKRVTLDFPSIAAGGTALLAVTVRGAAPGDAVIATPNGAIENGLIYGGYVASANTVTVRLTNATAAAIDPASGSWDIRIIPKELNVT